MELNEGLPPGAIPEDDDYQHQIDLYIQMQEAMDVEYERERQRRMEEEQLLEGAVQVAAPMEDTAVDAQPIPADQDSNLEPIILRDANGDPLDIERRKSKPVKKKAVRKKEETFKERVFRIAKGALGEENVSIDRQPATGGGYTGECLMLHWPFIQMTNREGARHDIKDMFVALPVGNSSFTAGILATRGTLSYMEAISNYRHSHLWTGSHSLDPFCTGVDGINDLWADLITTNHRENEDFEIMFEGFIHQLESFISYESLEGSTYIKIRAIGFRQNRGLGSAQQQRGVRNIIDNINVNDVDLSYDFNTGEVRVLETEHLHNIMASVVSDHQKRLPNGAYENLDASGTSGGGYFVEGYSFVYKGETRRTYVEPFTIEKNNERKERKYAHENIVREFIRRYESEGAKRAEAFCLQNAISIEAEEKGTANHWKRFDNTNLVHISETTLPGVERSTVLADERGGGHSEPGDVSTES